MKLFKGGRGAELKMNESGGVVKAGALV